MAVVKSIVCVLVVLVVAVDVAHSQASTASSSRPCKKLSEYFSPTGSFTLFKAMMERTSNVTDELVFGQGDKTPDNITMLVPNDKVLVQMLNDLKMSIHEFLTMNQTDLAKITLSHAAPGFKGFTKGSIYPTYNPAVNLTVLANDGKNATLYNGATSAKVNLTLPMYDICNTVWYLIDTPLLPPASKAVTVAGR